MRGQDCVLLQGGRIVCCCERAGTCVVTEYVETGVLLWFDVGASTNGAMKVR